MLAEQEAFCREHAVECVATSIGDRVGYAASTESLLPVNRLRHPAAGGTSGWYIWCGEEFSQASDFFAPFCASHVCERHPELRKRMGLPPGYRFLLAPGYLERFQNNYRVAFDL